MFIGKKISRRFLSGLLLVAVIPITMMGYGIYQAARNVVISYAYMHIQTIKIDHENHLKWWFEERLADLRVISQLSFVKDMCTSCCSMKTSQMVQRENLRLVDAMLAIIRAKSPSYQSIHIFSPAGVLLASTDPHSREISRFDNSRLFATVQKTQTAAFGHVHQHSNHNWYMDLAAPIRAKNGTIIGYTLAVLNVSASLDPIMTDRAGLGQTGESYLVDKNHKIITQSRYWTHSERVRREVFSRGIDAALEGKRGISVYTNYTGRKVIGSYAWLPRYHWALLVEIGEHEILAPMNTIRTAVVLTTVVVSGLCLLLALFMSRHVSLPIIRVAQASHEMAEGRLDQRIQYRGKDEIAVLAENFNSMAEKLSGMISSLRQKEASLQKAYQEVLEMQQQLVQSEKMAAIGELVASVVHEMRNPLSSIKLNLQIIGRSLGSANTLSEHYQIAIDQVSQLEKMFTDLMNYSKPFNLQKVVVLLEGLIEESLNQLEPLLKEREVTVARKLPKPLPPILADPDKMRQVLVNVLKNGIEASRRGESVEITGSVEEGSGRGIVHIDIADKGSGISPHDLKRIFQPFFTTKKKGTGLGLPIVKKIMDAHGYGITIRSEEAKGAVVHLEMQGADDAENSLS